MFCYVKLKDKFKLAIVKYKVSFIDSFVILGQSAIYFV